MPFKSQSQRGYMYIHHPEIAKEFESATPKGKKLPYKVGEGKRAAIFKGLGGDNGGGKTGY